MNTTANSISPPSGAKTPTLLITGATGSIGAELTKLLADQGVPFRAMVRSPKDAQMLAALPGADVSSGDFNDAGSLATALQGIERAFLLTNSSEQAEKQQLDFVAEAQRAGVQHIVKLSQFAADANSPVRFLRYHAVVELAIRESGMAFTFLRPNLFMQGLLGFRSSIVEQGNFFAAVGDATISLVDVRDIAAVAAAALVEPGHEGKIYTLTGPQALTHAEIADELSKAVGRQITFIDVPPAAMRAALAGVGFPDWQADGLIEDYAHYSRNEASAIEAGVEDATGKLPRNFADFARDYASYFV
ncbi:SDR family oxidoreductase [Spirosoma sp. KCTC 42546]|uniref:SDR family oxidoreductase n=1 Tax=Spirosoma sp. KCTC 42546 TaxID=2520506 RepID=UPI0011586972|nr:SDR family oxidoreductase [Spirosoma sp. KCTC 42546]QDK79833.1 SDR family oxidoreductase [Spirosoma sp. KCTC 42546]